MGKGSDGENKTETAQGSSCIEVKRIKGEEYLLKMTSVLEYRRESRLDFDLGMLGGVKLDYGNGVFRRYHVGNNPVNRIDPMGLDEVTTVLGTAGHVLNTWGMATGNPYVKAAGVAVSGATIVYSGVQYWRGKMSPEEAAINSVSAVTDIFGFGLEKVFKLEKTATVINGINRGFSTPNTIVDAAQTTQQRAAKSEPSKTPTACKTVP